MRWGQEDGLVAHGGEWPVAAPAQRVARVACERRRGIRPDGARGHAHTIESHVATLHTL